MRYLDLIATPKKKQLLGLQRRMKGWKQSNTGSGTDMKSPITLPITYHLSPCPGAPRADSHPQLSAAGQPGHITLDSYASTLQAAQTLEAYFSASS